MTVVVQLGHFHIDRFQPTRSHGMCSIQWARGGWCDEKLMEERALCGDIDQVRSYHCCDLRRVLFVGLH